MEAIYSDLAMPEDVESQDLLNITSYAEPNRHNTKRLDLLPEPMKVKMIVSLGFRDAYSLDTESPVHFYVGKGSREWNYKSRIRAMPKKFPVFTMSGYKLSNHFADVIISND